MGFSAVLEPHQKAFDLQARISGAAVFAAHREHLHPRFLMA